MASDAAELLLEGVDKIIDKHFDKTWDKTAELKKKRTEKKNNKESPDSKRTQDRYGDSRPSRASPPSPRKSRGSRTYDKPTEPLSKSTSRRSADYDPRRDSADQDPRRLSPRQSRNDPAYGDVPRRGADYNDARRTSSRRYASADRDGEYRSPPPRRSNSQRSNREYERDRARRDERRSRGDYPNTNRYAPPPSRTARPLPRNDDRRYPPLSSAYTDENRRR